MAETGKWTRGEPLAPGWYAVLLLLDGAEGVMPSAAFWSGKSWARGIPIGEHAGPFESQELASAWAYDNDPEE